METARKLDGNWKVSMPPQKWGGSFHGKSDLTPPCKPSPFQNNPASPGSMRIRIRRSGQQTASSRSCPLPCLGASAVHERTGTPPPPRNLLTAAVLILLALLLAVRHLRYWQ